MTPYPSPFAPDNPHCLVANTNDVVCKISGSLSTHVYLYNCIVGVIRFKLGCSVVCIPRSNFSEYIVELNRPRRRSRIIIRCYRQTYPLSKSRLQSRKIRYGDIATTKLSFQLMLNSLHPLGFYHPSHPFRRYLYNIPVLQI